MVNESCNCLNFSIHLSGFGVVVFFIGHLGGHPKLNSLFKVKDLRHFTIMRYSATHLSLIDTLQNQLHTLSQFDFSHFWLMWLIFWRMFWDPAGRIWIKMKRKRKENLSFTPKLIQICIDWLQQWPWYFSYRSTNSAKLIITLFFFNQERKVLLLSFKNHKPCSYFTKLPILRGQYRQTVADGSK